MLFGPVVGMMAGVCTDVLGYFAGNLSMGAYFPGYTLTAVVGGLIGLSFTAEKRRSAATLMQNLRMMLHRTLAK